jgi:hypothetical protein
LNRYDAKISSPILQMARQIWTQESTTSNDHVPRTHRTRKVGELVHMDTQQQPVLSHDGKIHTLTFVENESRVDLPSFLKKKSDVSVWAVKWLKWLKRQTGNKEIQGQRW